MNINCVVEHITYRNPDNGWSVMKVTVTDFDRHVTLVGNMPEVAVGCVLQVEGNWKADKQYGNQFVAESWKEVMPATVYGIEKYLGSGLVKGIGPVYAKAIVSRFGLGTIDIIENDIDRLREVPNLGKKRIERIARSWEKQRAIKNVMIFLQGHGVTTAYAAKIYSYYGKEAVAAVEENPYRLADDIRGIGFKTADKIADRMGYAKNDPLRCRSGLLYTLNRLSEDGHVFAEPQQLVDAAVELLEADRQSVEGAMARMIEAKELIAEPEAVYLPPFYYAEQGSATLLQALVDAPGAIAAAPEGGCGCGDDDIVYDDVQRQAIDCALNSKVMVLTGGPGTGKTTTTKGIIAAFKARGCRILLAAPTGRAAKRLSEATSMEAKTIHRLLEYNPMDGYKVNGDNPLDGDVLIVDECSMIDILLFYNLMKAVPPSMRLILVGDIDQLPSVGAGNVLHDIIDSQSVAVVRLTRIFRQAQSSRIVMNAHAINSGAMPDLSNGHDTDFFFIRADDPEAIPQIIVDLVQKRLSAAYGVRPREIQVLTPMQRGVVGTGNLNQLLQQSLNPAGNSLNRGGFIYREGDKVMQIRNNYDKGVFNGDIGYITAIDTDEGSVTVIFDARPVEYDRSDLDKLTLAYAITIHKSQGSEFPIVVMPVTMKHYVMLQRNLVYTGITRAKRICVVVGTTKAMAYAIQNRSMAARNSRLCERLNR